MATERKWIAGVSKLNRTTQEGSICWSRMNVPASLQSATNDVISSFYGTTSSGRNIAIYEVRSQEYVVDFDRLAWVSRLVLAFFTDDWEYEVEFPEVSGIGELMEAVRQQAAGVDSFLDELLEDKPKES